jgi:hypothetical protein
VAEAEAVSRIVLLANHADCPVTCSTSLRAPQRTSSPTESTAV